MRRVILVLALSLLAAACSVPPSVSPPASAPAAVRLESIAEKRGAFARGYELFRRGDLERALPIFTELVTAYAELADYHLYFVGAINQRLGHNEAAEAAWSRLLRDYPQSVQVPAAALGVGQLLLHTDRLDQARPPLQIALGAADTATVQAARFALAEADERSGAVAAAYAGFMQVRRDAVGSTVAGSAKQAVLALRAAHADLEPVGADRLEEGRLLIAEHDYPAAEALARQLTQAPADVDPADALRLDADALYGLGNVDGALAQLQTLVDRYPSSPAAPAALFRSASVRWNRDDDAGALQAFEEFRRLYPRDRRAAEGLYAIGRIHERAGRSRVAIASYAELARRYPRNTLASEAQWRIGWIPYVAHSWTAAATAFAQLAGHSQSRQRTAAEYWEARTLEHAGQTDRARALYRQIIDREPSDYYAAWAEQRLAGTSSPPPIGTNADLAVAVAPPNPVDAGPAPATERFHLQRSDELRAAGALSLARGELAAVDRDHHHDPAIMRYLLHAYPTVDGWAAAMRLLHRLGDNADLDTSQRERFLYPLAFWTNVSGNARAAALDPFLVVALMRQESMFDPEARSSANAYGLMQLLPSTARRVSRNDQAIDSVALLEPALNIQLGTTYLGTLMARFGDPLKAVAAYNGGESAVEKWQRRFPDLDADEFVESISYRETRDYVKRVISNYRKYRQLYGAG